MMKLSRRAVLGGTVAAGASVLAQPRRARAAAPFRLGVLTDLSGPYRDIAGPVAVAAAQQAVEDFNAPVRGMEVEVVMADHLNRADVAAGVVRDWYDHDGVDVVLETINSDVALTVAEITREKNKVYLNSGAATSDLTSSHCNANTIAWTYDTYMLARSTGTAMVQGGGKNWFFITADYAFGHALQRDTTQFIERDGGKVAGSVLYPFPGTVEFGEYLHQAKASGADVIGLASTGADTQRTFMQAHQLGVTQRLAGLLVFISDVHAMGLDVCQDLLVTESFYWDLNDRTRDFSHRLRAKAPSKRPTMVQAGVYSSVLHYLKTAYDLGGGNAKADGAATVARMKAMPTDDDCFGRGSIRPDGRKLHPVYLFQVKKPAERRYAWDYYKLVRTTPADQAFRPIADGQCAMAKA